MGVIKGEEKEKEEVIIVFERNNGSKLPKFSKKQLTDSRSWTNHKQDKPKEINAKTHHSQTSETKIKKSWKKQETGPTDREEKWFEKQKVF